MKKILAIALTLALIFALAACSGSDTPSSSGTQSGGETSSSGSSTSSSPASTAPSAAPAPVPSDNPYAEVQAPDATGDIGYMTDDVDHYARAPYHIMYISSNVTPVNTLVAECLEYLGGMLNYTFSYTHANGDQNNYINNVLPAVILSEPDGLIVDMVFELQGRLIEVLGESGIPYVSMFNSVTDENGYELVPVCMMNQYVNGKKQLDLMNDLYSDYWGEIDTTKLGHIALYFSLNADLTTRGQGAMDRWVELYPDNPPSFHADSATYGNILPETGYDLVSGIISTNPQIEYWFITSCVEDMALGSARATEALGRTDSTLITGSGSSILPREWGEGYNGNWIGNFAVSNFQYAVPAACGVIAMIDGRATAETLWEDLKRPGDSAAQFVVGTDCITRAGYAETMRGIEEGFGIYRDIWDSWEY